MTDERMFKPDLSDKQYTIIIDVYPNVNVFRIADVKDELKDTLQTQHIIGAIETVKGAYLREQSARAIEAFEQSKPEQP